MLGELRGHLELLGEIGDDDNVGVTSNSKGEGADTDKLKEAYKGLKGIVEIAKGVGVKEPSESNVTLKQDSIGVDAKEGAKVLTTSNNAGAAVGEKAVLIVTSVRGEEMLASIVKSGEGDVAVGTTNDVTVNTSAMSFAMGGSGDKLAKDVVKAGAVSGGIAMRGIVKGGKLAANNGGNDNIAVQGAGITAVNKLLKAVEEIVKKTVKNIVDRAKGEIDKARSPKVAISEASDSNK